MRYALFGDSHATVVFPQLTKEIETKGGEVVISKPKSGWTLKKHLQNGLESLVSGMDIDILLLSLGGNNHNLTSSYQEVIDQVLDIAKNSGIKKVVWVSPAWATRDDVQKRHEWTSEFLKTNLPRKVRFIDIRELTKDGQRDDGVHFYRTKYKEWADYVGSKLFKHQAITQIPRWTWWATGSFIILSVTTLIWKKLND